MFPSQDYHLVFEFLLVFLMASYLQEISIISLLITSDSLVIAYITFKNITQTVIKISLEDESVFNITMKVCDLITE